MLTYNVYCEQKPWVKILKVDPYVKIDFGNSAEFRVMLFTEDEQVQVGVEKLLLSGLQYEQWMYDEPYIRDFILATLGCVDGDGYSG